MPACISDSKGNLLFYSDGVKVFNKNHELMEDGILIDNYATHFSSSLYDGYCKVTPFPGHKNKYVLFYHAGYEKTYRCLYYAIIDMNANNGLGKVEKKNIGFAKEYPYYVNGCPGVY